MPSPVKPVIWPVNVDGMSSVSMLGEPANVTESELVPANSSAGLVWLRGMPITPSPFSSWWKVVSNDSSVVLFPDTRLVLVM